DLIDFFLGTEQRNEIFNQAVHTKDGIEPATLFAQEKVDAAVAWDPDMSDAVSKRPGSKKIYDTKIANRLIADILVVSDSFSAKHPQTLLKFSQGWLEGVEFIKTQPERAYNLIGTVKDFNIPSDLAKRPSNTRNRRGARLRLRRNIGPSTSSPILLT